MNTAALGGEAPRPIRYGPWAGNPQLLGPSTGSATVNCCLAPVGNGLARSDREAAFGTAYREKHGGICIFPPYPNIQPWFQSGFADGMSKPIPYGVDCFFVHQHIVKFQFDGEAPRPIRYEPWAINPQLLGPSTDTAQKIGICRYVFVGNGFIRSAR